MPDEEKISWKDTNLALSKIWLIQSSSGLALLNFGEESFSHGLFLVHFTYSGLLNSSYIIITIIVGSEIDHKVKHAAALGEDAWEGMGEQPELRIWRIEKFHVKPWPKEQYGEFFKGDSYIGKFLHCARTGWIA